MAKETNKHKWRFYRAGGFEQVRLESGFDLLALAELDQKLWTALACPVKGLEVDEKTLELIDTDKDGRIRAPELIAAITWIGPLLKDPNTLMKGSPKIVLSALADNDDGKRLAAAARQTLRNLGKKDAGELSADDMAEAHKSFDAKKFNGDGIVPPTSAEDDDVRAAIDDVLRIVSGVKDRADVEGVDRKKLDEFFDEAEAFSAWHKLAEDKAEEILPLGEKTASAAAALGAVAPKIEDYFTRVKLAAFDARATVPLSRDAAEYAALSPKLLSDKLDEVAGFPLAKIEPDQPLPLTSGLNPAWSAKMAAFAKEVVAPLLGDRPSLTEADFREVVSRFAAHEAWLADKKGARVEPLGKDRVRELLDRQMKGKIIDLLAQDEAEVPTRETLAELDKLVRLHRDLARFANNFVTFRDFYARKKATFQAGTLYLDGKSCDLCVYIESPAAHAAVATRAGAFLVYCDITRKGSGEKGSIVAAVTNGEPDAIIVGRNGIFYDRKGQDWDATVTRVIENPISLRQAFWMPYKRVLRLVEEQIEKFASSREKEMEAKTSAGVTTASATATAPAPAAAPGAPAAKPAAQAFDIAKYVGIFAAIGLAVGAIGTALAAVVTGFLGLKAWQMPLVLVGLMLLISGPSLLIAYMKLRRRNIAPVLDPAGWAVNAQAKLNVPFGASLTQIATLPAGASRSMEDPFEEKRTPWLLYLFLLALLGGGVYLWRTGTLGEWWRDLQTPAAAPSAAPSAPAPSST